MDIATAADPFAEARSRMVDSQIRPNKVTDPRLLAAMRSLPRERFVPPAAAALAYADEDVVLGNGRVLMEPMVLARLVQMAAPRAGEKALVVGAGTGYGAAVLAACGPAVTALEESPDLLAIARPMLAQVAPGVAVVEGPLTRGWEAGAPWDIILIEGAVHHVPDAIVAQLKPGAGRLVTVRAGERRGASAVVGEAAGGRLTLRAVFDCATPVLPAFRPAPAFAF